MSDIPAMKRKKKNKALPLIILVGIMCVLGIAYAALSVANDRAEAKRLAEEEAANAVIMLAELDSTKATKISYHTEDGEWITLEWQGTAWKYAEDENFPVDQTIVSAMVSAISRIGATRSVDEGSVEDYGLDTPSYEIHITYNGNTTYRYAVGDENSFNGEYYFLNDDGGIYMISSGLLPYFQYAVEDLLVLDTPVSDINSEYITEITVTDADGRSCTVSDADGIVDLYGKFIALNCTDWVDYSADEAEMTDVYGIGQTAGITISYKKTLDATNADGSTQTTMMPVTTTVYFGNSTDEGVYYTLPKSTIVYRMSSDIYEAMMAYLNGEESAETETAV